MTDPTASSPATTPDDGFPRLRAAVAEQFKAAVDVKAAHLFTTDAPPLFAAYLEALAPEHRQRNTCSACRGFVHRYGGLVTVDADGRTTPVMWDPGRAPPLFAAAVEALAATVARATITGVFLTAKEVWGEPVTGEWKHLAITPPAACVCKPTALKTAGQQAAVKREDYSTLVRGLEEFPIAVVRHAHTLLSGERLYRSEKCLGVAKWLLDLHERRAAAASARARDNLTWLAVAAAPVGFCHVRSSMIGTLLEDLVAGLPLAQVQSRFAAKMHPLQYQRPTAPPSAGNIAQAEKIIATLKAAGALERRFARLADIRPIWTPKRAPGGKGKEKKNKKDKGTFGHLAAKGPATSAPVDAPLVTMTWDKFSKTVLPGAELIEYLVPAEKQSYLAMVTAKNADAPPIVQWDFEDERNPITFYVYVQGSPPAQWNLRAGVYHPVTAVTLHPATWSTKRSFTHHGGLAIFILEGAKDTTYTKSAGFFPEFLKAELHEIRSTLEAYAKDAMVAGKDDASACGICLTKGGTWNLSFRVTTQGVRTTYKLDRWD